MPVYNEEENLTPLLNSIVLMAKSQLGVDLDVLAINDGSSDNSEKVLYSFNDRLNITVIYFPENRGLGIVIKEGLLKWHCASKDGDILITMDADNTHMAMQIPSMISMIRKGYDVVIASRFIDNSNIQGVSLLRRCLASFSSFVARTVRPILGVRDYTCGYRAYNHNSISNMYSIYGDDLIVSSGFGCMLECLLKLRKLELKFTEVPLDLRYNNKRGPSKMRIISNILKSLLILFKY